MTTTALDSIEPLDQDRLGTALRTLRDSGMVVIPGGFPPDIVDALRNAYDELLAARPEGRVQSTSGEQHVQMQVPLVPPFSDELVVAHPIVRQLMTATLGDDFACSYYNSNTAYPGSTYQRVHRDMNPIYGATYDVPTPAVAVVLNIPLCDFTVENGSTEVWPGSHLIVDTPADAEVSLDDRIQALSSTRLNVSAGSIVLRDLRVWHRGMPNDSDRQRTMLAVVYKRVWHGWMAASLRVPRATWDGWPEHVRAIFASAPIDDG